MKSTSQVSFGEVSEMEALVELAGGIEADGGDPMRILRRVMSHTVELLHAAEAVVLRQGPLGDYENIRASGSLDDAAIARTILARLPRPLPARRIALHGPLAVFPLDIYHLAVLVSDEALLSSQALSLVELLCRHAGLAMENARLREELSQSEGVAAVGRAVKRMLHDLRNPIGRIQVAVERAEVAGTDAATVQRMHSIITGAADDMLDIANEVSEFTNADRITKIRITADSLLAALQDTCMQIPLSLRCINQHSGAIHCDPQKLLRSFTRLLESVYGPDGLLTAGATAVEPVAISVTRDSTRTHITVGQDGHKGEPTSLAPLPPGLFEPFAVHNHHGVKGLALATVRSVITAHGGDIAVVTEGVPGHFVISLPGAA